MFAKRGFGLLVVLIMLSNVSHAAEPAPYKAKLEQVAPGVMVHVPERGMAEVRFVPLDKPHDAKQVDEQDHQLLQSAVNRLLTSESGEWTLNIPAFIERVIIIDGIESRETNKSSTQEMSKILRECAYKTTEIIAIPSEKDERFISTSMFKCPKQNYPKGLSEFWRGSFLTVVVKRHQITEMILQSDGPTPVVVVQSKPS